MLNVTEVIAHANNLMIKRHGESIRSRQIFVLAEALVAKVNEELMRRDFREDKKDETNEPVLSHR